MYITSLIIKNKLSRAFGGRISYADWALRLVQDVDVNTSSSRFYDVSVILTYQLNPNNRFSYSFYNSGDRFSLASDTAFHWSNLSHVLKYDHSFSERFSVGVSAVRNEYRFTIGNSSGIDEFDLNSEIFDNEADIDLNYNIYNRNGINCCILFREKPF